MRGRRAPWVLGALAPLLLLGLAQCRRARTAVPAVGAWDYVVSLPPAGSWKLEVEATFEGAAGSSSSSSSSSARFVVDDGDAAFTGVTLIAPASAPVAVPEREGAWVVPACRSRCTLRYAVDLDALAAACHGRGCSRRVGDAVLGQASDWMLRPETPGEAVVRVNVRGDGVPSRFATGLVRDASGAYTFRTEDLGEASFTAYGAIRRTPVDVGGAKLDVVVLGQPLGMGDAAAVDWVRGAAGCVGSLYGRFPTDATIFVIPLAGADTVVFGRAMSLTGASVELLFGADTPAADAHNEWVVPHELFHLTCPTFVGEGRWLEEGLATYYEPVLRARAGWYAEADLWGEFSREMPRGLRKPGAPASLEERDDIDSTYWGGAIFALLADVGIRQATRASAAPRGLDDVLRAMLQRYGNATHRARLTDFVATGEAATGTRALDVVYESWAVRGQDVDLDALWRSLGVEPQAAGPDGHPRGAHLRDDAPLADVRRAIAGSGH